MEESMRELKMVADGSLKRIVAVERRLEAPPPPPPLPPPPATGTYPMPLGKTVTGKYPPMTEKLVDPLVFSNHLRGETRYKGTWKGYSVPPPPHPPNMGVSHSAPSTPNFRTNPIFEKYFATTYSSQLISSYPAHKQLPKLDFPKFNGENPKI
jgi:hypothetical protein